MTEYLVPDTVKLATDLFRSKLNTQKDCKGGYNEKIGKIFWVRPWESYCFFKNASDRYHLEYRSSNLFYLLLDIRLAINTAFLKRKQALYKLNCKGVKEMNGLYELIGGNRNGELCSADLARTIESNGFSRHDRERLLAWLAELKFWEEYSQIYFNLEKAWPYHNLSQSVKNLLDPKKNERWLDVGCGPLKVSELIYEKSLKTVGTVEAIDVVLEPAKAKLTNLAKKGINVPVILRHASITDRLPYPDNFFDGIGANLILPYVIDFIGKTGKEALEGVLREMFRVLKPGGHMVWSTPKHNVQFAWVFMASIPDMLNLYAYIAQRDFTRILQGTRVLRHALMIQKKGRKGIYTFLPKEELERLLLKIGFVNPVWKKTFVQQVWVNRVEKP